MFGEERLVNKKNDNDECEHDALRFAMLHGESKNKNKMLNRNSHEGSGWISKTKSNIGVCGKTHGRQTYGSLQCKYRYCWFGNFKKYFLVVEIGTYCDIVFI